MSDEVDSWSNGCWIDEMAGVKESNRTFDLKIKNTEQKLVVQSKLYKCNVAEWAWQGLSVCV